MHWNNFLSGWNIFSKGGLHFPGMSNVLEKQIFLENIPQTTETLIFCEQHLFLDLICLADAVTDYEFRRRATANIVCTSRSSELCAATWRHAASSLQHRHWLRLQQATILFRGCRDTQQSQFSECGSGSTTDHMQQSPSNCCQPVWIPTNPYCGGDTW